MSIEGNVSSGKRSTVLRRYYVARVRCTSDSCFPPVDFNITRFSFRFYSSTCPAESSRKLCPSPSSDLDHPIAQSLTYPTSNECLRVMLDTYFDRRFGNQWERSQIRINSSCSPFLWYEIIHADRCVGYQRDEFLLRDRFLPRSYNEFVEINHNMRAVAKKRIRKVFYNFTRTTETVTRSLGLPVRFLSHAC